MPYVLSLGLLVLGLLLLLGVALTVYRALRRFEAGRMRVRSDVGERSGLLKARVAGLRVALDERRYRSID